VAEEQEEKLTFPVSGFDVCASSALFACLREAALAKAGVLRGSNSDLWQYVMPSPDQHLLLSSMAEVKTHD
jgi:hypothetical protein